MPVLHVSTYQLYDSPSPIVLKKKIVLSKENKLKDGKTYCPSLILTFHRSPRVVFAVQAKPFSIWNLSVREREGTLDGS